MSDIDWLKIIAFILRLIADGLDKNEAISKVASHLTRFHCPRWECIHKFEQKLKCNMIEKSCMHSHAKRWERKNLLLHICQG